MPPNKPSRRLLDDCFLHDKERLKHAEALAILRARVQPVTDAETVPLDQAAGRILAQTVTAPRDVPLNDNAAVDGYAFGHASYEATGGFFPVETRVAAGHPAEAPLLPGRAARIFTGGVMPEGADTIAMQEDCENHDQDGAPFVIIPPGLKKGANRRRAGEDLASGTVLLDAGTRLRPQDIAAIASVGLADVFVSRRLRVALLSTGDEIVRPGAELHSGQVYDSNHYLLRALLETLGVEITDLGVLADDYGTIRTALEAAAETYDVIMTTGGASRGEEDHLVTALDDLGSRHMWQLAIKPGRPMNFGQIGDCVQLGLPGNPVAVMVCFLLYARPALLALSGAPWSEPVRYQVPADFEIAKKKPDRREFLRGILRTDADGTLRVEKFARDGSGLITGLREADGLIEIAEEVTSVAKGALVPFIPFSEFGLPPR
ncbi:gephyrin-like molybdotransferase Glp [Breoghania sp. L-A4]|uniref:molybdopterin molybdotransferase MoeA n=1 Tax=Breoghania sp. L-A4 TaxID=2304600 RepID=UPI000E3597F3|nr:gephyrin-like molybdotransferase Glp [Breoghania sp. L-A4]AXS40120.1 molybdopterin molybdenumtransferase MoeA [Breoghania sp. L-A4]